MTTAMTDTLEERTEQHWKDFSQFCLWEKAAGGPDPHMVLAAALSEKENWTERVYRAGIYVGFYNVPSAEVFWQHFPHGAWHHPGWLAEHWAGLSFRRERRAARTIKKMSEYLESWQKWSSVTLPQLLQQHEALPSEQLYEVLWQSAMRNLRYAGRYACFKLMEALRRFAQLPVELPDIRPIGGESPRYTLGVLFPKDAERLRRDNTSEGLKFLDQRVQEGMHELKARVGVIADYYMFEVFLCDYRQSWEGKRQYPGRSQDSEMDYHRKIAAHWGAEYQTDMWRMRDSIFPYECLGEQSGWPGVRKELGAFLSCTGLTWSDLVYDYPRSKANLAHPLKHGVA